MKSKRSIYASTAAAAAFGLAALLSSTAANAQNVYWSVGVSSPGVQVGVQNAPPVVYLPPQVVYQQPQVVYQQPQVVYVQPRPVYVQPQPVYYTQPAPIYYGAPQVIYRGGHYGKHHGWHHGYYGNGHHGNWQHGVAPQVAVRISGQGYSNDQGRNHH